MEAIQKETKVIPTHRSLKTEGDSKSYYAQAKTVKTNIKKEAL